MDGAAVEAEVLRRDRGDKVIAFKYRPKARRRVKKGHRQELTVLRIADIRFGGKSAAEAEGKAKDREKTERQKVEAAAARQAAEDAALAAKLAVGAEKAEKAEAAKTATKSTAKAAPKATAAKPAAAKADTKADTKSASAKAAPAKATKATSPKADKADTAKADDGEGRDRAEGVVRQGQGDVRRGHHRCGAQALAHEEGRVAMAHKKAGSSVKNGRDSAGQRLGVKAGDGQLVTSGSIIVRQRGMTFASGEGTGLGHDYTVFATVDGKVRFEHATRNKKRIRVIPVAAEPIAAKA